MAQVTVKSNTSKKYQQEIKSAAHSFVSDAPEAVGGLATGPDPHELLLASLGSCTAITLEMYAAKKGWDLKSINIDLQEESVDDPANPGKKVLKITRDIKVEGDFDAEQIESLKSAADRCPIHKILNGPKHIDTVLNKN
ncbi:MAG: OsmC family protein [Candidatus Obscuribacterales bacterium]|nr:OsmC family protein [Cyanobacteria bacterium SZAS LIN-5]RTL38072.1 MAG: OsmC family peroxiredoxin [Candidatus Melainabacteria bacterium]